MKNRIHCLIIEPDHEAIRQIDAACRKVGTVELRWKTNAETTGVEIIRKHRPEMVVVGLDHDPPQTLRLIGDLAKEFPFLFLLALSGRSDADLILQAMRAGAHDFLCKPVKESDLAAASEKVAKLRSRKEPAAEGGKVLSVFSNKGGNGTTTIAVNLAGALAHHRGIKVVAVDLALSRGDVPVFFNVSPSYSILDFVRSADKADYDFLHSLLVRHPSGVHVLAEPPAIEDAELISAGQVREALGTLRSMFDVVVVDTPHQFDERTLTALEMSETVLLVSLLDIPSIRNTQRCLELFRRLRFPDERMKLVLNRHLPDGEIPRDQVEGILGIPVFCTVPNDYPTVISSINRGKLLHEVAPDREVAKSFRRMADLLLDREREEAAPERKPGLLKRMFSFERSAK
jgi:pilus assembly protein CpaE